MTPATRRGKAYPWGVHFASGDRRPTGKPCDQLIWLTKVYGTLTDGLQRTMPKGCETVFLEIEGELRRRGVRIDRR